MKCLVCNRRPARGPAVPGRACGRQCLRDLPGKFPVCMEGPCVTPAFSPLASAFPEAQTSSCSHRLENPWPACKTLQFGLEKPSSWKRRHPPEKLDCMEISWQGTSLAQTVDKNKTIVTEAIGKGMAPIRTHSN